MSLSNPPFCVSQLGRWMRIEGSCWVGERWEVMTWVYVRVKVPGRVYLFVPSHCSMDMDVYSMARSPRRACRSLTRTSFVHLRVEYGRMEGYSDKDRWSSLGFSNHFQPWCLRLGSMSPVSTVRRTGGCRLRRTAEVTRTAREGSFSALALALAFGI